MLVFLQSSFVVLMSFSNYYFDSSSVYSLGSKGFSTHALIFTVPDGAEACKMSTLI